MQQLISRGIYIGLAGHILSAKPNAGRQPSFSTRLAKYIAHGFRVIESDIAVPLLPTDDTLRALFKLSELEVFWRVGLDDIAAGLRFFSRPEWTAFVTTLAEERLKGVRHSIVLALDRSVRYTQKDFEPLMVAWASIAEFLPCMFEFESGTWKKIEPLLVASKVPRIELDAPHLPALIKPMNGEDRKRSYVKLVGRNAKDWLKHDTEERYCHSYTDLELSEVAERIVEMRSRTDEVAVIVANYPADAAQRNALTLAKLLAARLTGVIEPKVVLPAETEIHAVGGVDSRLRGNDSPKARIRA
jgi:uncharacterized protein YecE (DUF72 family)